MTSRCLLTSQYDVTVWRHRIMTSHDYDVTGPTMPHKLHFEGCFSSEIVSYFHKNWLLIHRVLVKYFEKVTQILPGVQPPAAFFFVWWMMMMMTFCHLKNRYGTYILAPNCPTKTMRLSKFGLEQYSRSYSQIGVWVQYANHDVKRLWRHRINNPQILPGVQPPAAFFLYDDDEWKKCRLFAISKIEPSNRN